MSKILRVLAWPHGDPGELNPYVRMIYEAFVPPDAIIVPFTAGKVTVPPADVFHVHWPEGVFAGRGKHLPPFVWLKMQNVLRTARRIRKKGGIVALTAHNLHPHDRMNFWQRRLWRRYHQAFINELDLLIGLSNDGLSAFRIANRLPDTISDVIVPHPNYRSAYRLSTSKDAARQRLEIDLSARVLGLIGSVRPSKNIPDAIRIFRSAAKDRELLFVAGGCPDEQTWLDVVAAAGGDRRVLLRRGALSDFELSLAFSAIDACLISQPTILNSGVALAALSFDRVVIAPSSGAIPELQAMIGQDWLRLYALPLGVESLRRAYDISMPTSLHCDPINQLDSNLISKQLLLAFSDQLALRRRSVLGAPPKAAIVF